MTDEMMGLRALLEKSSDADQGLLREIRSAARDDRLYRTRLMELEIGSLTGAGHGERSSERINWRNGYRERDWETRAGTVERRLPKLRRGSYFRPFSSRAGWPRRR